MKPRWTSSLRLWVIPNETVGSTYSVVNRQGDCDEFRTESVGISWENVQMWEEKVCQETPQQHQIDCAKSISYHCGCSIYIYTLGCSDFHFFSILGKSTLNCLPWGPRIQKMYIYIYKYFSSTALLEFLHIFSKICYFSEIFKTNFISHVKPILMRFSGNHQW